MVKVKLIGVDEKTGKFKLSRKVLMPKPEGMPEGGGGRGDRDGGGGGYRGGGDRDGGGRDGGNREGGGFRDRRPQQPQ